MRPLLLSATAFGPFAETVEIDFTALHAEPLFLIHGDTGAGKTSILDALCFALYGEATGSHRESRNLRSDFAAPDTLTQVTLQFALQDKHYRIVRTPQQERPKARGSGMTRHMPTAHLYSLPSGGTEGEQNGEQETLLAEKLAEVLSAVESLLGLSLDQFRQVIVLPQGEFQRFLYAKSNERELIFEKLFATERYRRLSDWLKSQARQVSERLNQARNEQQILLQNVDCEDAQALALLVKDGTEAITRMQQQVQAAEAAVAQQHETLLAARTLQTLHQSLKDANAQWQRLQSQAAAVQETATVLIDIDAAQLLAAEYSQLRTATQERQRVEELYAEALHAHQVATTQLQALATEQQQLPAMQTLANEAQTALERLQSLQPQVTAGNKLLVEQKQHQSSIASLESQLAEDEQALAEQRAVLRTLRSQIAERANSLRELPGSLSQRRLDLERQVGQRQALDAQQTEHTVAQHGATEAQREMTRARDARQGAQEKLQQAQKAHQAALAAELASTLQKDEPCPVCGSTEHPDPAHLTSAAAEQIAQAQQACEQALKQEQQAEREQAVANARLEQAQAAQEKDAKLGSALPLLTELQIQLDKLTQEDIALAQLQQQEQSEQLLLQTSQQQIEQREQGQRDLVRRHHEAKQALTRASTAISSLDNQVLEFVQDPAALTSAIAQQQVEAHASLQKFETVQQQGRQAEQEVARASAGLAQLEEQRKEREQTLSAAQQQWLERLQDSTFSDQPAFEVAHARRDEAAALRTRVQDHRQQESLLQARLESLRADINDRPMPDVTAEETASKTVRRKLQKQQAELADRQAQLAQWQQAGTKLRAIATALIAADKEYALVGTLSEHANGQREQRVSLQRFVQGAVLDQVLIEASAKLHEMSNGQYQLIRRVQSSNLRSGFGLELDVEDALTGEQRPVQSLSGGESFLAALALALSLSDVVRAFAGGVQIDTLFIDEGFGSLDPEALDRALNELIKLGRQGRMVGIISHVSEIKERVAAGIALERSTQGSRLRLIV